MKPISIDSPAPSMRLDGIDADMLYPLRRQTGIKLMSLLQRETGYLLTSAMYFTRIPGIRNAPWDAAAQREALKYFPLIGWLVGGVAALLLIIAQSLLPLSAAVAIAVLGTLLLTGAMHEDGLADSADAFGGGFDRERVLEIMKDPAIGAYGVMALVASLGLRFLLLAELAAIGTGLAALALMFGHAASRFAVLPIPAMLDYVQSSPNSKSRDMVGERLLPRSLLVAAAFVLLPLLLLGEASLWIALIITIAATIAIGYYFRQRIGGYSGDCLGATQQIAEILIYATILAAWTSS